MKRENHRGASLHATDQQRLTTFQGRLGTRLQAVQRASGDKLLKAYKDLKEKNLSGGHVAIPLTPIGQ